jgi:hypothetical protein
MISKYPQKEVRRTSLSITPGEAERPGAVRNCLPRPELRGSSTLRIGYVMCALLSTTNSCASLEATNIEGVSKGRYPLLLGTKQSRKNIRYLTNK